MHERSERIEMKMCVMKKLHTSDMRDEKAPHVILLIRHTHREISHMKSGVHV